MFEGEAVDGSGVGDVVLGVPFELELGVAGEMEDPVGAVSAGDDAGGFPLSPRIGSSETNLAHLRSTRFGGTLARKDSMC